MAHLYPHRPGMDPAREESLELDPNRLITADEINTYREERDEGLMRQAHVDLNIRAWVAAASPAPPPPPKAAPMTVAPPPPVMGSGPTATETASNPIISKEGDPDPAGNPRLMEPAEVVALQEPHPMPSRCVGIAQIE